MVLGTVGWGVWDWSGQVMCNGGTGERRSDWVQMQWRHTSLPRSPITLSSLTPQRTRSTQHDGTFSHLVTAQNITRHMSPWRQMLIHVCISTCQVGQPKGTWQDMADSEGQTHTHTHTLLNIRGNTHQCLLFQRSCLCWDPWHHLILC